MRLYDVATKCEPTSSLRDAPKETATCFDAGGPAVDDLRAPRPLTLTTRLPLPRPRSTVPHVCPRIRPSLSRGAVRLRRTSDTNASRCCAGSGAGHDATAPLPAQGRPCPRGHGTVSTCTPGGRAPASRADNTNHTVYLPGLYSTWSQIYDPSLALNPMAILTFFFLSGFSSLPNLLSFI